PEFLVPNETRASLAGVRVVLLEETPIHALLKTEQPRLLSGHSIRRSVLPPEIDFARENIESRPRVDVNVDSHGGVITGQRSVSAHCRRFEPARSACALNVER